jgi:hypothetical protein
MFSKESIEQPVLKFFFLAPRASLNQELRIFDSLQLPHPLTPTMVPTSANTKA